MSAGELGRDLVGSRGDGLSKIDCRTGIAIALDRRGGEEGVTGGEDGEGMDGCRAGT